MHRENENKLDSLMEEYQPEEIFSFESVSVNTLHMMNMFVYVVGALALP